MYSSATDWFPSQQDLLITQNLNFLSKSRLRSVPSMFPILPYGERRLCRAFLYISFRFLSKRSPLSRFPSQSSHRDRCSVSITNVLFIHSSLWRSSLGAVLPNWENFRQPSKELNADGWPAYSGVRSGIPRGSFTSLLSLLQCHAAFSSILSTLACVDYSPASRVRLSNSLEGAPPFLLHRSTDLHVTLGYGKGVGFMEGFRDVNNLTILGSDNVLSGECSVRFPRQHNLSNHRKHSPNCTVSNRKRLETLTIIQFTNKQQTNISVSHNF